MVLEIWKESTNFRFTSCLTFFWVRYVDAIGRNDVGHLRKRFQIYRRLFRKTANTVGLEQSKGILFVWSSSWNLSKVPSYQECSDVFTFSTKIMFSNLTLFEAWSSEVFDIEVEWPFAIHVLAPGTREIWRTNFEIHEWQNDWRFAALSAQVCCLGIFAVLYQPFQNGHGLSQGQFRSGSFEKPLTNAGMLWSHSERAWCERPFFVKDCPSVFFHFHPWFPSTVATNIRHYLVALIPSRVTSRLVSWCSPSGQLNQHPWAQSLCAGCFGSWSWH